MPKAERGSIKDLSNRMKARGLQKLKFYCQLCSKQCRDENGFKCHLTSNSHLNNMKNFCHDSSSILDSFSQQFEKNYLDVLYKRHRTNKMNANVVYQEVIQDKEHVHMNATKWNTLTDFVQYLGKSGKCVVEETERGWYVTFIERDPTILAQQENYKRRVESEKAEEEKVRVRMEKQRVEAAKLMDRVGLGVKVEASNLVRGEEDAPIEIALTMSKSMGGASSNKKSKKKKVKSVFGEDDSDNGGDDQSKGDSSDDDNLEEKLKAQLHQPLLNDDVATRNTNNHEDRHHSKNMYEELNAKTDETSTSHNIYNDNNRDINKSKRKHHESTSSSSSSSKRSKRSTYNNENDDEILQDIRKKHWIKKDILTRIITKKIKNGKYYKRKCIITKVYNKYKAQVELLDSNATSNDGGDVLDDIDQDDLETVIPKVGKKVMILNGRGRGMVAELMSVDEKKLRGSLKILDLDIILDKVDYNDFSKVVL